MLTRLDLARSDVSPRYVCGALPENTIRWSVDFQFIKHAAAVLPCISMTFVILICLSLKLNIVTVLVRQHVRGIRDYCNCHN